MFKKINLIILIVVAIAFTSCNKYQKLLKSKDSELKYTKALEFYNKGDYFKAVQLFDELIFVFRGTPKSEKIYYYYTYCHYFQDDYILASHHFKQFAKTFPKSEFAEECFFMSAYCTFKDSPHVSLDQTNTIDAIKELQLFINIYPNSARVKQCNELIDKLRLKLEVKDFSIAKLYYQTKNYNASIYAFNIFIKEYPGSKSIEDALFYVLKSNFIYAENSIESKKKERYRNSVDSYNKLVTLFPQSKYLKEAGSIYKNSTKELEK